MKVTGIVNRVDDVGRIAIPKEVRRQLGIKESTPLEVYVEDDSVVFKKYDQSATVRQALGEFKDLVTNSEIPEGTKQELYDDIRHMMARLSQE